jgi:putative transport protein
MMDAMARLFTGHGTATTILAISLTAFLGLFLGRLAVLKVKLGIAGVLFSGLLVSHFGLAGNAEVLHFVREFGLILFVYAIGIDVGPRFFSSFRDDGLRQNLLAACIVFLGFGIAYAFHHIGGIPSAVVTGILCGAVTNTPSLGAAQQVLIEQGSPESSVAVTTMGYAVAYPFGILGIILTMAMVRLFFRIRINDEARDYSREFLDLQNKIQAVVITLTNANLFGKTVGSIRKAFDQELVISRIWRTGTFILPMDTTVLQSGDEIYGVSEAEHIPHLELALGRVTLQEKQEITGEMAMAHVLVTKRRYAGKTIEQIGISRRYEANITRIFRSGIEILPGLGTTLELGDTVRIVGKRSVLNEIRAELGNSVQELAVPNTLPIFVGIFLGICVGSVPIFIPGLPAPAKLGLAGGPLLVAILIGNLGRIGSVPFYMTPGANMMLREIGIILFLACVGLLSGGRFVETLVNGGYIWMAYGAVMTLAPLMIVGVAARLMKINYLKLCGILAGSMTDPPALEFANALAPVPAQSTSYATVYPLTMFLRVFLAQILILLTL